MVAEHKVRYLFAKYNKDKAAIAQQVLHCLKLKGYRFVKKKGALWVEATPERATTKVKQALREGAKELRELLEADKQFLCGSVDQLSVADVPAAVWMEEGQEANNIEMP